MSRRSSRADVVRSPWRESLQEAGPGVVSARKLRQISALAFAQTMEALGVRQCGRTQGSAATAREKAARRRAAFTSLV